MRETITYQLLSEHLVEGKLRAGEDIAIRIDRTITRNSIGALVYLEFEAFDREQMTCSLLYSPYENEGFHHIHRRYFAIPGKTLLGVDLQAVSNGSLCMLAMAADKIRESPTILGIPHRLVAPKVSGVYVTGFLRPFVFGQDIIGSLVQMNFDKSDIGRVIEFNGPGLQSLSMADRTTIAEMSAYMGFAAAVFPSDEITKQYLARNGREADWRPFQCGRQARWDEHFEMNLSTVEPIASCRSNPVDSAFEQCRFDFESNSTAQTRKMRRQTA